MIKFIKKYLWCFLFHDKCSHKIRLGKGKFKETWHCVKCKPCIKHTCLDCRYRSTTNIGYCEKSEFSTKDYSTNSIEKGLCGVYNKNGTCPYFVNKKFSKLF